MYFFSVSFTHPLLIFLHGFSRTDQKQFNEKITSMYSAFFYWMKTRIIIAFE